MEPKKDRKKEKIIIMMILILIALIIIIFLLLRNIGKIQNQPQMPTGNVDIFEIIFGNTSKNQCNCGCDCQNGQIDAGNKCDCNRPNCICNQNTPQNTDNNANAGVNNNDNNGNNNNDNDNDDNNKDNDNDDNDDNEETQKSGIEIYENGNTYAASKDLDIFTQTAYYVVDGKIAPGSENTYQFIVKNNNDFNIKYDLDMIETNEHKINMKYRLRRNGKYIIGSEGEYVTAEEIMQKARGLSNNGYDVYELDWKWEESSRDTEIGKDINANYKLNLKITATQE